MANKTNTKKKSVRKTGKKRTPVKKNAFGQFLAEHEITPADAAKQLDVTRAYVQMLATGKAKPSLPVAYAIEKKLTRGKITVYEWV